MVERHVANVQVDGSNPFTRSNLTVLAAPGAARGAVVVNFGFPGGYDARDRSVAVGVLT